MSNSPTEPKKNPLTPVSLPAEISKILEGLPPNKKREIEVTIASHFQGPLPPPETLSQYNQVVHDGAERIFRGFETQMAHRIQLEDFAVKNQIRQSGRGQIFGFLIALFSLGLSTVLAFNGFEILASTIGGSTVLGLVTVFVIGKKTQKKDLEGKQPK